MERQKIKDYKRELINSFLYAPLPVSIKKESLSFFLESIPDYLSLSGADEKLLTKSGVFICERYERIIVTDYGVFVEIKVDFLKTSKLVIEPDESYKVKYPDKYANAKYIKYFVVGDRSVNVIYQLNKCAWGDFKPHLYYIALEDLSL